MFTKEERAGWAYWFAHWCAFQMTALNLKTWKPRFLFHDIEKPFMKAFGMDYREIQYRHRHNNAHHIEYWKPEKFDYLGMVIDWECSRFTKAEAPLNARETYEDIIKSLKEKEEGYKKLIKNSLTTMMVKGNFYSRMKDTEELRERLEKNIPPLLDRLGL